MGCGIGCGVLILVLVVAGTLGFYAIRQRMQSFADAGRAGSDLEHRYGKTSEFTPEPGAIPRDRIAVFLQVRERAAPARAALETSFRGLSDGIEGARRGDDSFPQIAGIVRRGFGVLPKLGEFQASRTKALLECGMGQGEYFYIYVLAYYSWLGKSPQDGPPFRIADHDQVSRDTHGHGKDVQRERRDQLVRHIQRNFTAMLRNQIAKLERGKAEAEPDAWIRVVDAELTALARDTSRIPWQDRLPASIENSLRPFRPQLEASYSELVNPLELNIWTAHENERDIWWNDR
jgi:hypothetical protein